MDKITEDARRLYEEWRLRLGKPFSDQDREAFLAGWGVALFYAAQARETERRDGHG
jgi:hypothetical protein